MVPLRRQACLAGFVWLCSLAYADPAQSPEAMLAAGRVDNAISFLQVHESNSPNDAAAYNLLCRAHFMLGSWDAGITGCEKAVALDPNNSSYHLWLGRIYGEKASHVPFWSAASLSKKVHSEFETAVRLDPKNADARRDLAEFYIEAPGIMGGGKDKAEAQAQELMHLDAPKAYWVSARIAEKKKDYTTAESEYRNALQASHGRADEWLDLAFFYRHIEHYDQMEDAIQHVRTAAVDRRNVLMEAAEVLIRAGRNSPAALDLLHQYLENPVEDGPAFKAHYLLGTLLEQSGDKQGAAREYETAISMANDYSPARIALQRLNAKAAHGG